VDHRGQTPKTFCSRDLIKPGSRNISQLGIILLCHLAMVRAGERAGRRPLAFTERMLYGREKQLMKALFQSPWVLMEELGRECCFLHKVDLKWQNFTQSNSEKKESSDSGIFLHL
jgi:hypothetical protein